MVCQACQLLGYCLVVTHQIKCGFSIAGAVFVSRAVQSTVGGWRIAEEMDDMWSIELMVCVSVF